MIEVRKLENGVMVLESTIIIGMLFIILMISLIAPSGSDPRIKLINKKLDRIMERLGMEEENIDEELKDLLREGKMVEAVKRQRQETGMGLKEAKEYVDELERR